MARLLNDPSSSGSRLLPVTGEIITEIEAVEILFELQAKLVAGGGVCGAEGAVWLSITGEKEKKAKKILDEIATEKPFAL